jgi:hypothetical protein
MQIVSVKIIRKFFAANLGKTAIETTQGTAWVNGNQEHNTANEAFIQINEVGDTFIAAKDSANGHFKAGDKVTRQTQSIEFKSFVSSIADQFVAAAASRGLAVNFVVQG